MKLILTLALMLSPVVVRAATPPAALSAKHWDFYNAGATLKEVKRELPAWELDPVSRYEWSELDAVRLDILACDMASDSGDGDGYWINYAQLRIDIGILVAVDDFLNRVYFV